MQISILNTNLNGVRSYHCFLIVNVNIYNVIQLKVTLCTHICFELCITFAVQLVITNFVFQDKKKK